MHWIEAAKRAREQLPAGLEHGRKQKALAGVAQHLGLARQSLRNILAAHDFLESVAADREAYRSLAALPNTSVEVYARWHRYDPVAALVHAKRAAVDGLTVKTIISEEKEARARHVQPTMSVARSLVENYRGHPELFFHEEIRRHLRGLGVETGPAAAWCWDRVDDPFSLALGVRETLTFFPSHGPTPRQSSHTKWKHVVGVLDVGERALREGYRKLAKGIMARAISGTLVYPVILVVAPDTEALEAMTDAMPRPFRKQGASPATLFVLEPRIGGIMFTSADRAERDLYQ